MEVGSVMRSTLFARWSKTWQLTGERLGRYR